MFAKVPGYVRKWNVDIGDRVHKGDVLAELGVPEMEVDLMQKAALVQQAEAEIKQAQEIAAAAEASLRSAEAKVKEAESSRLRARAEQRRTKSQYERLTRVEQSGVVDKETVEETRYGFEAAEAALEEVEAKIRSAEAARDETRAKLAKARADVLVAEAHRDVARENRDQVKALLEYTRLTAPFDGVVTRRSVDTGHFVQPATGVNAVPLYVVARTDLMRVFVEVPEADAAWVGKGAKARIRVPALSGQELTGTVARTSYALDRTARTLLTEIDLPNPNDRLRPGLYAVATLVGEHADVLSLPVTAVVTQGDVTQGFQSYLFLVEDGKARRTLVELGVRGDQRVEVLRKQTRPTKAGEAGVWQPFTGDEVIVRANAGALADGQAVTVASGAK